MSEKGRRDAARESRWAYGSVTAGEWPVLQDGEFRTLWVAKVGSDALIVSGEDFRFPTPEEALAYGASVQERIRASIQERFAEQL